MKTILLIGKNGQVGWELQHTLRPLGHVIALDRAQMDLTQPDTIRKTIREASPEIIVNAAGYTTVDKAEQEPGLAAQVNTIAPGIIAEEAKRINALLIHYSTDYVFDGTTAKPYVEADVPNPINIYGKTKLAGEQAIVAAGCAHLILRTSWIYSTRGTNFVLTMLRLAREKKVLAIVDDQIGSPTWAHALAVSTAELAGKTDQCRNYLGIYHLSAGGYASRLDFAKEILATAKIASGIETGWAELQPTTTANYPLPAKRPLNAATNKEKVKNVFGIELPCWEQQLHQFVGDLMASIDWRHKAGF
ncbi:MAG: dTDP-4-dehydrorhamnose reductase [Burkholderiales bacterium]